MGPLRGFRIIEIAGIGPTQLCGMLLADMGARVIRVCRPSGDEAFGDLDPRFNLMNRGRHTVVADLKTQKGVDLVLRLCDDADAIFEGFRPGVMEKVGLGPDDCRARNERLVYGRMTGWGQHGPLANAVGHDTNYIALAGALHVLGDRDRPPPVPLNLIGDFGGGALYLAMGILAAMLESQKSGKGQVVDAAMVDGAASMLTMFYGLMAAGVWRDRRQSNFLDGAAPFAKVYLTADDRYVSVCAIEPEFFGALLDALGIDEITVADQWKTEDWPKHESVFAAAFSEKTRDEWDATLIGRDACFAPVLSLAEAPRNEHNAARGTFVEIDGIEQPGPAPRFSRTRSEIAHGPEEPGANQHDALSAWGLSEEEIRLLV
jgi:alpha-methylacyl-CoA racemase